MLKFDKNAKTLSKLSETNFRKENLLERTDLQAAIIGSWDVFRNEIGFSSAVLIGQEINPDDSTADRLDILALDAEDSSLVIFELKRDKNKLQLLQGITYAAMASIKEKMPGISSSLPSNSSNNFGSTLVKAEGKSTSTLSISK